MSVASALMGTHRDCLIVASFGQEPEIQCLVSRGQIISADLPYIFHIYNYIKYSCPSVSYGRSSRHKMLALEARNRQSL